jgi:hypothetical protein
LGCLDWEDCSQEWVQRFCNHSADCCRKVVTFQETPQAILYLLTIGTTKMERYSCCKPFLSCDWHPNHFCGMWEAFLAELSAHWFRWLLVLFMIYGHVFSCPSL